MSVLDDFRKKHPIYKDTDDKTLADGIFKKYYAEKLSREDFDKKIGMDPMTDEPNIGGELVKGFKAGVDQAQAMLGSGLELAGKIVGNRLTDTGDLGNLERVALARQLQNYGTDTREQNMKEAEENAPAVASYTDIGSLGDAGRYAAYAAGNAVPMMAPSVAGGLAGAAVAGPAGALAGAMAPSYLMSAGEANQNLLEKGVDDPEYAALLGVPVAALDALTPAGMVGRLTGKGVKQDVAEGLVRRFVTEGGRSAASEGATEIGQEAVMAGGEAYKTGEDLANRQTFDRLANAGLQGAIGGGVIGGALSPMMRPTPPEQRPAAQPAMPAAPPAPAPVMPAVQGSAITPDTVPQENYGSPSPAPEPTPIVTPDEPLTPGSSGVFQVIDPETGDVLGATEVFADQQGNYRLKDEIAGLGRVVSPEDVVLRQVGATPPAEAAAAIAEQAAAGTPSPITPDTVPTEGLPAADQSINQPVNPATDQPTLQPISQPVGPSVIQPDTVPREGLPTSVPSAVTPDTVPREGLPAIDPSVSQSVNQPVIQPVSQSVTPSAIQPDTVPREGLPASVPSPVSPDTVPREGLPASVPSPITPDTVPTEGLPAVDPNPFPPSPVSPDTVPRENLPASVPSVVTPDTVPNEGLPAVDDNVISSTQETQSTPQGQPADPVQTVSLTPAAPSVEVDASPFKSLRSDLRAPLEAGERVDANRMREIAEKRLGQKVRPNTELSKQVEEQAEAAVSEIGAAKAAAAADPVQAFDELVDLYDRQPKLATRTGDSARRQAFSTPVPLAYVAGRLAGVDKTKTVYEPTAGTGMLVLGADPAKVTANEIDANRASILRDRGFNVREGDALQSDVGEKSDVVISNPPFGMTYDEKEGKSLVHRVKMRDGSEFKTTDIGHAIALDALTRKMKADGKAVLILGSKYDPRMEKASDEDRDAARAARYRVGNTRQFYVKLFRDYNVTDHFTVAGDLYGKQGTVFPVDVIVVDGARKPASDTDFSRPLPAVNLPRVMKTWDELKGLIDGTESTGPDRVGATGNEPGPVGAETARETARNEPDREPVPAEATSPADEPSGGSAGPADTGPVRGTVSPAGQPSGGGRGGSDRVSGDPGPDRDMAGSDRSGIDGQPEPVPAGDPTGQPDTGNAGGEPAGGLDRGSDQLTAPEPEPEPKKAPAPKPTVQQDAETEHQVAYKGRSNAASVGSLSPKRMQDAMDSALGKIEDEYGDVDKYVAGKLGYEAGDLPQYFSAEQVDALALAIENVDRGRGFIIGDQTGVGKGRFVAAMLRYAARIGKVPVFVTQKPGLYKDMIRDLTDIGMPGVREEILTTNRRGSDTGIVVNPDTGERLEFLSGPKQDKLEQSMKATGKLPAGYKYLFTTYDQLNYKKGGAVRDGEVIPGTKYLRQEAVEALAPNAMMVLDESHSAGGSPGNDPRVDNRDSFFRGLVRNSAGSVFSSATFAKNPHNMTLYASTDMALAVGDPTKLAEAIQGGGVPLQQVVSRGLVQAGQMVRRERSWDGIEVLTQMKDVDPALSERIAGLLREGFYIDDRFKAVKEEFGSTILATLGGQLGKDPALNPVQVGFAQVMHNVIKQALVAIKVDAVVDYAAELYGVGKPAGQHVKPVITISNTMEGVIGELMEQKGIKPGQSIKGKVTFNDIFLRYLGRMRTVIVRNDEDPENPHRIFITDDMMRQMGYTELLGEYDAIAKQIKQADLSGLPISPIDEIKAGLKAKGLRVGEITGRGTEIVDGRAVSRDSSTGAKIAAMDGFNNGSIDALIINRSGATGFSLHASERVADQQERHMVVAQPEADVNDFMQMLGRINRTGQVVKPKYSLFFANLPAERRPTAQLLKKLSSLNANTSANAEGNFGVSDGVDFQNKYGGEVVAQILRDEPDVAASLGISVPSETDRGSEGLLNQFTGRIQILPLAEQERLFGMLIEQYRALLDNLNATGQNTLEAKELDVDAKVVSSVEIQPAQGASGSVFEQAANFELVDVKKLTKPLTLEKVQELVGKNVGMKEGYSLRSSIAEHTDGVRAELENGLAIANTDLDARAADAQAKLDAEIAKATEEKPNVRQIDLAAQRVNGIAATRAATDKNFTFLTEKVDSFQVGKAVFVESGSGDNLTQYTGVVTNVRNRAAAKNPLALSNYVWTVHTSRDTVPLEISAAQIASGTVTIAEAPNDRVRQDFENGINNAREKRGIITGNILAGYSKLGNKGTITAIRMSDGTLKDAVMMPVGFNLEKELAKMPVEFGTPAQIADFVGEVELTRQVRTPGGPNEGVHITKQRGYGGYLVLVKTGNRRDRPLYTAEKITNYLRHNNEYGEGFVKRKWGGSDGYSVVIRDRSVLEGLLKLYMDPAGFGLTFSASMDTARAREITGAASVDTSGMSAEYAVGAGRGNPRFKAGAQKAVEQAWKEMGLPIGRLRTQDTIRVAGNTAEFKRSAGYTTDTAISVDGMTMGDMAVLALDAGNPRITAFHEGFHVLQNTVLTPEEKAVLARAKPRLRKLAAQARGVPVDDPDMDNMSDKEIEAYAFQRYVQLRDQGLSTFQAGPVQQFWGKLYEIVQRFRNKLNGLGFQNADDLFERARRGDLGARVPDTVPQALETYQRMAEQEYALWPGKPANRTPQVQSLIDRTIGDKQGQKFPQQIRQTFQQTKSWSQRMDLLIWNRAFKRNGPNMGLREAVADSFDPIKRIEEAAYGELLSAENSPYKAARLTKNLGSVMGVVFKHGALKLENGQFKPTDTNKGLEWVFEGIAKAGALDEWKLYRVGLRAQRLTADAIAAGKKNTNFLPAGVTIPELLALKTVENRAMFEEADRRWNEFNGKMLDMAVQAGILSQSSKAIFTATQDYIPFYRVLEGLDDNGQAMTKGGLADQKGKFLRIKGSDKQIDDPIFNIVANLTKLVDASYKNRAMYTVKDMAVQSGAMKKAPNGYKPANIPTWLKSNQDALEKLGIDWDSLPSEAQRQMVNLMSMVAPTGANIVSVMVNGKPQYYEVLDPGLLRAVKTMGPQTMGELTRIFAGARKILTQAVTADPVFMVRNSMRDTLSAWVTGNTKGFRPVIGAVAGFTKSLRNDPSLQVIAAAGGGMGAFYSADTNDLTKHIYSMSEKGRARALHMPGRVWEAWTRVGRASEQANRIEIYQKARQAGASEAEAAYQALDIMDFGMRGSAGIVRTLTDVTPFLNARIQGLDRLARGAGDNPKRMLMRGMILMGLSLALMAAFYDDDRYKELEDWDKDGNYHFWIGDQHYKIPKPFEIGLIFSSIPERVFKTAMGTEDTGELLSSIGTGITTTLAFNPLTGNPITNVWHEQSANKVSFTGRPIESLGMDRLDPERRVTPYTSATAQLLGEILPETGYLDDNYKSPVRIEAAIRGLTGAMGMYALAAGDQLLRAVGAAPEKAKATAVDNIPVLGPVWEKMTKAFLPEDKGRTSKFVTEFYEMSKAIDQAVATINDAESEEDEEALERLGEKYGPMLEAKDLVRRAKKDMTELNKESATIRANRDLSADEKKAALDEINTAMKEIARDVALELDEMGIKAP